jgi:hypothetical protein
MVFRVFCKEDIWFTKYVDCIILIWKSSVLLKELYLFTLVVIIKKWGGREYGDSGKGFSNKRFFCWNANA